MTTATAAPSCPQVDLLSTEERFILLSIVSAQRQGKSLALRACVDHLAQSAEVSTYHYFLLRSKNLIAPNAISGCNGFNRFALTANGRLIGEVVFRRLANQLCLHSTAVRVYGKFGRHRVHVHCVCGWQTQSSKALPLAVPMMQAAAIVHEREHNAEKQSCEQPPIACSFSSASEARQMLTPAPTSEPLSHITAEPQRSPGLAST